METRHGDELRIVALAGGVGGAKLAHGLTLAYPEADLSVIVNTGDDFSLFGLHISPDLDTVMYTLAGIANPETGWGVAGDSSVTLDMIQRYGRDAWFWLGDKDLATHILRTERLRAGATLTEVTAELAGALDVRAKILPMCDELVTTLVQTPNGLLEFQDYFVRRHHVDDVQHVHFKGIEAATLPVGVSACLDAADAIILCPSNPIVSIGPILSVYGFRDHIRELEVPVVAVSPIVGGQALRGPADRMLKNLGHDVSALGVAKFYRDFLTGIVIDKADQALAGEIENLGLAVHVAHTVMTKDADREALAREALTFAEQIRR